MMEHLSWDECVERRPSGRLLTRTTHCCRRRWSNGPWRCSGCCCRVISRSFSRSTGGSSIKCARTSPGTMLRVARMSLIDEAGDKHVRMAHLAIVGSHSTNGVARNPYRAAARTIRSGTSPRCFPTASTTRRTASRRAGGCSWPTRRCHGLISQAIGDDWITNLDALRGLTAARRGP